jgi:hypothetical protein
MNAIRLIEPVKRILYPKAGRQGDRKAQTQAVWSSLRSRNLKKAVRILVNPPIMLVSGRLCLTIPLYNVEEETL